MAIHVKDLGGTMARNMHDSNYKLSYGVHFICVNNIFKEKELQMAHSCAIGDRSAQVGSAKKSILEQNTVVPTLKS